MGSPPLVLLPEPEHGRVHASRRIVRSTDVTPDGRLRLDALARYLQWAAEDDVADAGLREPIVWLARRTALAIGSFPRMTERLSVRTFCSATGPSWAERTTTLTGADGSLIQARTVWAAISEADGRPARLTQDFHRIYGPSAAGRTVSARLLLPRPPDGATGTVWQLRAADFGTADHVNNTVHWAAIEDLLADTGWQPAAAALEYHRPIMSGYQPRLVSAPDAAGLSAWLVAGRQLREGALLAAARLDHAARLS
jgi:acyl-ACP thioesterase